LCFCCLGSAREAFRLRDFELEDDFLSPDLQVPVIQLMPETLFPLVDQATDIFWSRRRYGEPVSAVCPPETYFSAESRLDNVDSCSQRSHETFVFHLVSEILQVLYHILCEGLYLSRTITGYYICVDTRYWLSNSFICLNSNSSKSQIIIYVRQCTNWTAVIQQNDTFLAFQYAII